MNILLINRSDYLGGAAIASVRLAGALSEMGHDVRMLVVDHSDDTHARQVATVGTTLGNRYRFLAERLGIFMHNGFSRDTLFKIDTATHGVDVSKHDWVRRADVIVLNWINQAMLSLQSIERLGALGKPIVWTMHDMWNCTGVCHHAYECTAYRQRCRQCPLLGSQGDDLSTLTQQRKRDLYERVPMHFVAVSNWLAQCCHDSALLADKPVSVIANPFPTGDFSSVFQDDNPWDVAPETKIMVMGAARLDDAVKGLDILVDTLQYIASEKPALAKRLHLVLYGDLRDRSWLDRLPIDYTYLGYVNDVHGVYARAHIVLSTSRYESFGYTLVEGMASGCIPVTTGQGGQVDIVNHRINGYVTGSIQPADVAQGIEWAVDTPLERHFLHEEARRKFDSRIIAEQYVRLFEQIID